MLFSPNMLAAVTALLSATVYSPAAVRALTPVTAPAVTQLSTGQIPDDMLTRAERTDFRETTRYAEVVEIAEAIAASAEDIHLTTFGYTSDGRPLPLLVLGATAPDPTTVLATGKLRVYLQGNIHAGEVCGKEALLMLARAYATNPRPAWADSLVLLVAPIYNADGNERVALDNRPRQHGPVGGMGQRPNAQGLDLNRDHTKLDSPEARSLAILLTEYDPHVAVDLHTTNGTRHAYHLTYSPPLHPNTPDAIDSMLRDVWLPEVTNRIRESDGWELHHYGNASPRRPGWYTFDHRPRFSNNYVGLRNRFGILSEAYAYATFEERIRATLRFVEEILDFAGDRASDLRDIVESLDRESVVGRELAVRAEFETTREEATILMGEVAEERHPYTGATMLRRTDVVRPVQMAEFVSFRATDTETAPRAYYVLPSATELIDRLSAHGVGMELIDSDLAVDGERFVIDSVHIAPREFQGRLEHTVFGSWVATRLELPLGAVRVPMNQPLGRLTFTLLEPQSDDGFVAWDFLEEEIATNDLPIYRETATASDRLR